MESIFNDFGIQPVLLAAQVVNFLILLFILNKLLYKPILKILNDRQSKIEKSLKQAEQIEKTLLKTEEDKEKILAKATDEAKHIIDEATKSANQIIAQSHQKAAADVEDILQKGQETLKLERIKIENEIKANLSQIVALSLEKITGQILSDKDQKKLLDKSLKELN